VHIGDSHLQADVLSGVVRQKMQLQFGNAGRGLVFPYQVARTNGPYSYTTSTNIQWEAKRNVFYEQPLPIGINGYTIDSKNAIAQINLSISDEPGLNYAFTKISLFHQNEENNYDLLIEDEFDQKRLIFKASDLYHTPHVSNLLFQKPVHKITLKNSVSDSSQQKNTRIYGMLLENDSSGIIYNTIAANGAEYNHYNKSAYFIEQLPYLKADLVIVSLGTNEAYNSNFNPALFYAQIDTLVKSINKSNPNICLLLTTPPDSKRKTKYGNERNADMKRAKLVIQNYCLHHCLPYWDLYDVMGGFTSMEKWYKAGIATKDFIHFSITGYKIQGALFYDALIDGYEKYLSAKEE
jgi:lysophospholipase L1-like esterase